MEHALGFISQQSLPNYLYKDCNPLWGFILLFQIDPLDWSLVLHWLSDYAFVVCRLCHQLL